MNIFQLKLFGFYNKSTLQKTILLLIIILFCLFNLSAQKESNIKLKVATGLNWKPEVGDLNLSGLLLGLEPKLKISKNTFIGLRIQATENYQTTEKYKPPPFFTNNNIRPNLFEATDDTQISFVPTFDYYFSENDFRPYLGGGIGYFMLVLPDGILNERPLPGLPETSVDDQVVFLIRGGLEVGKLSVELQFNYVPKADIKIPNGLIIGTVQDSFLALTIGYSFGIGKG